MDCNDTSAALFFGAFPDPHPARGAMRSEAGAPGAPDLPRSGKSKLPSQRTLLGWLFAGRLVLAVGVLLGAGLVWTQRPQESRFVSVAVLVALVFTAYGGWVVYVRQRQPGNSFLLSQ